MSSQSALKNRALRLLARREHSQKELTRKLSIQKNKSKNKEDLSSIHLVIHELKENGYQSDERFAECYTRSRASKGYGPIRIQMELKERGISEELIERSLSENEIDWHELAQDIYQKRFDKKAIIDIKEKSKRYRFMIYRGFSEDVVKKIVKG